MFFGDGSISEDRVLYGVCILLSVSSLRGKMLLLYHPCSIICNNPYTLSSRTQYWGYTLNSLLQMLHNQILTASCRQNDFIIRWPFPRRKNSPHSSPLLTLQHVLHRRSPWLVPCLYLALDLHYLSPTSKTERRNRIEKWSTTPSRHKRVDPTSLSMTLSHALLPHLLQNALRSTGVYYPHLVSSSESFNAPPSVSQNIVRAGRLGWRHSVSLVSRGKFIWLVEFIQRGRGFMYMEFVRTTRCLWVSHKNEVMDTPLVPCHVWHTGPK